jgi:hypothetical protein
MTHSALSGRDQIQSKQSLVEEKLQEPPTRAHKGACFSGRSSLKPSLVTTRSISAGQHLNRTWASKLLPTPSKEEGFTYNQIMNFKYRRHHRFYGFIFEKYHMSNKTQQDIYQYRHLWYPMTYAPQPVMAQKYFGGAARPGGISPGQPGLDVFFHHRWRCVCLAWNCFIR